jgi:toxin ParE1/3/4
MPANQLVISPAAKSDLKEIYQYGVQQWGAEQSAHYLDAIKQRLWLLLTQPMLGAERPELLTNTRSLAIQSHIVFYRLNDDQIEIIRVLHARQDPLRHLP